MIYDNWFYTRVFTRFFKRVYARIAVVLFSNIDAYTSWYKHERDRNISAQFLIRAHKLVFKNECFAARAIRTSVDVLMTASRAVTRK